MPYTYFIQIPQVKVTVAKLLECGASINEVARVFRCSTRSVKRIKDMYRPYSKNYFFGYDLRRLPRNRVRLIQVKISVVFRSLIRWLYHFDKHGEFNLEAVMAGAKPP